MQVSDARGVETLVRATDDHFGDEAIVAAACGLLRHLAKSDTVKELFVEIGGLTHASKVLEAHKQSVRVCTQVRLPRPWCRAGASSSRKGDGAQCMYPASG